MRLRTIACSCLLVAASIGGAKTLAAASPDCSRWIKEYQQGLARRAVLGKKHIVRAAHHLVVPKPRLQHASTIPTRVRRPRLSPTEMLKRFKVLCGEDLPDETLPVAFVPTALDQTMVPQSPTPSNNDTLAGLSGTPVPTPFAPGTPTDTGGVPSGTQPIVPPGTVGGPTGGGPTGGGPTGGIPTGGVPGVPIVPPTPITPAPVPEPGTLALLLTGVGFIPVVLSKRRKSRTS